MSLTVMQNSGIMSDDALDRLRASAIMAHRASPLPDDVIYYLRALEGIYLDRLHEQKKADAREIGWKFADTSGEIDRTREDK